MRHLKSKVLFLFAVLFAVILATSGCGNLKFLMQAGKGQMELLNRARPISEVIQDERTPPRIRSLLNEISAIKKFGEENGLKPTRNYTEYVKLDRKAAVWVVSASEKLRFVAKEWRFPIVGSFPYLGWFDLENAKENAMEIKKEGWDVDVRGAGAYSTLGWFRDAVLSTMIPEGNEALGDLVNVILHESVHATLYIQGQSYFNESIASFIADRMTLNYLNQTRGAQSPERLAYQESEVYRKKVERRFHEAYQQLSLLYSSSEADSEKLKKKEEILKKLQDDLHYKRNVNNATLIQYKTYKSGQEDLEALFLKCDSQVSRFLKTLRTLDQKSAGPFGPFGKEQQDDLSKPLQPVIRASCPQM